MASLSASSLAALLQLPIPDPDAAHAAANVPLAAGCLKACLPPGIASSVRLLPRPLADHGGDRLLLDWLSGRSGGEEAGLVGFTCYLWNLERSLALARRLKEARPGVRIVFGGPEIAAGAPVLGQAAVDAFVLGEGESVFAGLLGSWREGRELPRCTPAPLADLAALPNPYAAGALEARAGEPLYLESLRGCPQRCSYCFYGKQFPGVRRFPEAHAEQAFARAREAGVPEVYLMDPSFTAAGGLQERLRRLVQINRTRLPLHAELRLEAVTPETAGLMREAGFKSVEAGLQSTNPQALRAVHRGWDRSAFLRGAELLREQGIAIRTGIILGLPRDTLEGFAATLEFLRAHGLAEGAEVYPLSVLPGTELRERSAELGLEFMGLPPYWVLRTDALSEEDLFRAVRLAEEALDGELFPPILPRFSDPAPGITGFLDLRGGTPAAVLHALTLIQRGAADPSTLRLANCVTLLLEAFQLDDPERLADLEHLGARLLEHNPFSLFQLVLEGPEVPSVERAGRLAEAFHNPKHFFERSRYYQDDVQERFSARLFLLTAEPAAARRCLEEPLPFDLILSCTPRLLRVGRELLEEHPLLLVDRELPEAERREVRALYRGWEKLVLFRERP